MLKKTSFGCETFIFCILLLMTTKLFENIPLIEVAFEIQFPRAIFVYEKIYGFYNEYLSKQFPEITENDVLSNVIENGNGDPIIRKLSGFHTRKFFISTDKVYIIQIQPDKLLMNWRKIDESTQYPGYKIVVKEFFEVINRAYVHFGIDIDPNQYEMAYVNHIPRLEESGSLYDPTKYSKYLGSLPVSRNFKLAFATPLSFSDGILKTDIESVIEIDNNVHVVKVQNTARGYNDGKIEDWFDAAHEKLIKEFDNILIQSI